MSTVARMRRAAASRAADLTRTQRRKIAAEIVAPLRDYPEQMELARALVKNPLTVVRKNRRAGGTEGVGRAVLAALIAEDGWSCSILTKHLAAPTINWIERAGVSMLSLIREHGLDRFVRISRQAGAVKRVVFPWPDGTSELRVYDLAHEASIEKIRGSRAHLYWPDEMQSIELAPAALDVVMPTLADFGGHIAATGTPSADVDSYFRRISDGTEPGWHRVELYSWDNPAFGNDFYERWHRIVDTAVAPARTRFGLSETDLVLMRELHRFECVSIANGHDTVLRPEVREWISRVKPTLLREYFGRWVVSTEEYVFDWYLRADLYYCRVNDLWSDVPEVPLVETMAERVALLPKVRTMRGEQARDWRGVLSVDIGLYPDPAAWVLWGYSMDHPRSYELWSEKRLHMPHSEIFARTSQIVEEARALGVRVTSVIADLKGPLLGAVGDWDRQLRARVPGGVRPPASMRTMERVTSANLDLAAGVLQVAAGSELDVEGRHLKYRITATGRTEVWKKRPVVLPDGAVLDGTGDHQPPGDHCLDCTLYALEDLRHIWGQEPPDEPIPQTTAEAAHLRGRKGEFKRRRRR